MMPAVMGATQAESLYIQNSDRRSKSPEVASMRQLFITGLLGLVTAVPALTQTTPIANVYVQTKSGVRVYNAAPSGQLTLVAGSPFGESGQMEAVRGTS